ncbi:unnamed protein product [Cylicocyclus nassatus]|uniref:Uncharacterized protein n=1 Tax=Cylicocyclus nassatus TaxID=53992 RepID=A0AA36GXV6_CYLNA|nr:unnamed protein product [Cylicocyclus nassatus]
MDWRTTVEQAVKAGFKTTLTSGHAAGHRWNGSLKKNHQKAYDENQLCFAKQNGFTLGSHDYDVQRITSEEEVGLLRDQLDKYWHVVVIEPNGQ